MSGYCQTHQVKGTKMETSGLGDEFDIWWDSVRSDYRNPTSKAIAKAAWVKAFVLGHAAGEQARAETPAPREPWADINWDRLPVRWRQINGVRVDAETIAKWFFQVDDKRQRELEWLVEAACGVAQRVAAGEPEQAK